MNSLLSLHNLSVEFYPNQPHRSFYAVKNVNIDVNSGETVGIVGESGCGKSLTALSLLNLQPESSVATGTFTFSNQKYSPGSKELNQLRGPKIGMIFQEPMTALNPVYTVGEQLKETLEFVSSDARKDRREQALKLLERVRMDQPQLRLNAYPHELSGGQRQRVMIALALAGDPDLLIADEPTTALDVTIESKIIELFKKLSDEGLSILFISHDLPLVAGISDRIVVLYSGYSVESADADEICSNPQHPYTIGLLESSSLLDNSDVERLPVIDGTVPDPVERPGGCPFHPRCAESEVKCEKDFPSEFELSNGSKTKCWAREP